MSLRRQLAAFLVLSVLVPGAARAQEPTDVERAGRLFDAGRALMNENRFAEACAKFAESETLDPGGGTLLNLGICRRREGRTATAFKLLTEALSRARADGRSDRVATAERHLAELTPELSRVTVELWAGAPAEDVALELDGEPFDPTLVGKPFPLDPGVHQLRASQRGHETFTRELTLGWNADLQKVVIPPLRPSLPPAPLSTLTPAPAASQPARPSPRPRRSEPVPAQKSSRNWIGFALVSTGGLAIASGGYFGARALSLRAKSDRHFDGAYCVQQSCVDDWDQAKTNATLSNLGIGAGVIALGVGAYVLLRPSPNAQSRAAWALSLGAAPSGARASASAEF